ncbi:uncharacterized protein [Panulirus ornatus]|uniref:uncharacterized protein n=1 Tax=Panulirus ornatus TaxID=150431 RepID=UPI003A87B34B
MATNQDLGTVGSRLSPTVVALVRPLLEEATSAVIVHDGSLIAQRVTHDLISPPSTSLVLGNMRNLLEDPHALATFRGHQLNAVHGLAIFLFSNVSVVSRFLAAKPPEWLRTSLLLLSLSLHSDARELLAEAQEVRWSALLQARLTTSNNSFRHFVINFLPYNPPGSQLHLQVCDGRPLTRGQVFLERYHHFHGRELQVASWLDDFPFLFYDTDGQVQGMAKVMLDEVASRLHFTYHLQEEPPDGYWGELVNGTWMGMAGQVVRHEKDLIIDGFAILLDRYHSLDLSVPYFTDSYSAALKMPPPAPRWVAVVYPFQGVVWASVAATLLLLGLTLRAFIHAHPHTSSTHST